MAETLVLTCEAKFWGTGKPCHHPAKYLVLWDSMVVCGIHNRGFLRGIPLAELEGALIDGAALNDGPES